VAKKLRIIQSISLTYCAMKGGD